MKVTPHEVVIIELSREEALELTSALDSAVKRKIIEDMYVQLRIALGLP